MKTDIHPEYATATVKCACVPSSPVLPLIAPTVTPAVSLSMLRTVTDAGVKPE